MKRRTVLDTQERPPERLWRFRRADWPGSTDLQRWRAYRAARVAWAADRGMTPAQMRQLIPWPVTVDGAGPIMPRGDGAA